MASEVMRGAISHQGVIYLEQRAVLRAVEEQQFFLDGLKVATVAQMVATIACVLFSAGIGICLLNGVVSVVLLGITFLFDQHQRALMGGLRDAEWERLPPHRVVALNDSLEVSE